ncbi:TPA: baseplate wedge protein 53 [Candidatus Woesearchaeota archaeon]|nr:baseplate wedge protein 53 [Candidatus Woesearchaeota archaeon]
MYFEKFPLLAYKNFNDPDSASQVVTNILKRIAFRQGMDQSSFFVEYTIGEGETPEMIAYDYYREEKLHWVIMILNNIINPHYDWPMDTNTLDSYIDKKYPGKTFFVSTYNIQDDTYGQPNFSDFKRGQTIFKTTTDKDSTGKYHHEPQTRGVIDSWDPHLQKITVVDINGTGSFTEDDIIAVTIDDGSLVRLKLHRLVDISSEALHHFEKDTIRPSEATVNDVVGQTGDFYTLDPLSTPPPENGILGQTGGVGGSVLYYETNLGRYMGITAANQYENVITNRVYEERLNETKRHIRLLLPKYLPEITDEFSVLLSDDSPHTLR